MESTDVEIPMSVKCIKRSRGGGLEVDGGVVAKVPLITSVGIMRRRSSSSSTSSSSNHSSSQVEDQKINGEGDTVMHMHNFSRATFNKEV